MAVTINSDAAEMIASNVAWDASGRRLLDWLFTAPIPEEFSPEAFAVGYLVDGFVWVVIVSKSGTVVGSGGVGYQLPGRR